MPAKPSGSEKTYTVRQKRPNGDVHIIERKVIYDPETKQNVILGTRIVGKIPKGGTEIVPTRPKRTTAAAEPERPEMTAERIHTGMMDILSFAGRASGIDDLLYNCTDRGTAEKIISIARYMVAEDHPRLPGIVAFQLNHQLPYAEGVSEDVYHELFSRIGTDESLRQRFFYGRCKGLKDKAALAYDSTAIGTYSDEQIEARWNGKDNTGLKEIRLLVLYAVQTRQPVAFTKLPGNIPDVITIRTALKQLDTLGLSGATIITDNGYYSQENIAELYLAGFRFLMPVKTNLVWIREVIDQVQESLQSMRSICPDDTRMRGTTLAVMHDFQRRRRYGSSKGLKKGDIEKIRRRVYVHVFFNAERKTAEDAAFDEQLVEIRSMLLDGVQLEEMNESMQKRADRYLRIRKKRGGLDIDYNHEACRDACRYHGYVVFISSYKVNTFEALMTYRQRASIELFFEVLKQQFDGGRPRVWTADRLRGRMFVQFVALCYYEYLVREIQRIKHLLTDSKHIASLNAQERKLDKQLLSWLEHNSIQTVLRWFDTVETVTVTNAIARRRWSAEVTKRDKLFLQLLGLTTSF